MPITLKNCIQDGAQFYRDSEDYDADSLIASYPEMVAHDFDLDGAVKARERFAKEFPAYVEVAP